MSKQNTLIPRLAELAGQFELSIIGTIRTKQMGEDCVVGDCPVVAAAKVVAFDSPSFLAERWTQLKKASAMLSQEISSNPSEWRNADALALGTVILEASPDEVLEVIAMADFQRHEKRNELTSVLGLG